MSDINPEAVMHSAQAGDVAGNTGSVAVGSGNQQLYNKQELNITLTPPKPEASEPSSFVPPRCYDGRSELIQPDIADISLTDQKRMLRLLDGLKGSRCLLFDSSAMTSLLAMMFSQAMIDGLDRHYDIVCWLVLPGDATLMSLDPLFRLFPLNTAQIRQKNPLAQAITLAKDLRLHPTLLVLQGFDVSQAKSLPDDFSALLELALEDDIGRSSIVIISARASLASRWGAKLFVTTGY